MASSSLRPRLPRVVLNHRCLPSPVVFSPRIALFFSFAIVISDMSQPSPPSSFQTIFSAALQDYEKQTGARLVDHPIAKKLNQCDSAGSITTILQEQARTFHEFRGDDGTLMKSLKCSVDVLYTLSGTVLGEGISLVRLKSFIEVSCS